MDLLEPNTASHLVWWVGGVFLAVLALMAAIDLVRDLRWRLRSPGSSDETAGHEPSKAGKAIRRRHLRPLRTVLRSRWPELPDRQVAERTGRDARKP